MDQAHCSECGATVAPDAPWCTLCFAPTLVPEPVPAPAATAHTAAAAEDASLYPQITAASFEPPATSWPCAQCGAQVPMSSDVCAACGAGFLAAGTLPTLRLPLVGDLSTRSKAQRFAIAGAVGLGVAVVLVAIIALLGALF